MKTKQEIKREEINKDFIKEVKRLEDDRMVKLHILEIAPDVTNFIYYGHSNELVLNWSNDLPSLDENHCVELMSVLDRDKLPEGIKIKYYVSKIKEL